MSESTWWVTCSRCGKKEEKKLPILDGQDEAKAKFAESGWQIGGSGKHWLCPSCHKK